MVTKHNKSKRLFIESTLECLINIYYAVTVIELGKSHHIAVGIGYM